MQVRRLSQIRLLADTRGTSLLEFGLMLPLLCVLCVGGLELSNLALAYQRVSNIAIKTADHAARVRTSIDETDINEIFIGSKLMGAPLDFANNGRIILSSIEPVYDSSSPPNVVSQLLRWQRCAGANAANSTHGNQGDTSTTGFGPTGQPKIMAAKNTAVMLAEVVYNYQPLIIPAWYGPITIKSTQAITVRERSDQVVKNAQSLTTSQKALCTNPHTA
jgi:hypothetical protein